MKYRTIVVDPPWEVSGGPPWGGGNTRPLPYPTMHVSEIMSLPVRDLAESDSHLYLWTINRYVRDAYNIAPTWGFTPSTLLTWVKTETGGGLGGTYRLNTEWVLFARRGTLAAKEQVGQSAFHWPRQRPHSSKPEAFLDMVERVSPGPYLELFARRNRLGLGHVGQRGARARGPRVKDVANPPPLQTRSACGAEFGTPSVVKDGVAVCPQCGAPISEGCGGFAAERARERA